MLPLFPPLLPEEPLFSAVARYGDMMAFETAASLHRTVFGVTILRPAVDLPGRLNSFLARLLPGHGYTADHILEHHSALPYFGAFLPPATVEAVAGMLRDTHGRSAAARLGVTRPFRPPAHLRFCDRCVADDRAAPAGVAYWRRVHQLPGVILCPLHDWPLTEAAVDRWARLDALAFISLERALAGGRGTPIGVADDRRAIARAVAAGSLWLLQHPQSVKAAGLDTAEALWGRFRSWSALRGWTRGTRGTRGTRLRANAFAAAARDTLGTDILAVLQCALVGAPDPMKEGSRRTRHDQNPPAAAEDWIAASVRRPLDRRSPLVRLLLLYVIGVSVDRFFAAPPALPISDTISLDGPCGNPACVKHDPPVPRPVPHDRRAGATRVVVTCPECGYRYSHGVDETRRQKRLVLETGARWDARLRALVADPSSTGADFARDLDMGLRPVQRHAVRLNVWHPTWTANARRAALDSLDAAEQRERDREATRDARRARWLALRSTHPTEGRTQLHARDRVTYFYLHEFDKAWLTEHLPPLQPAHRPTKSIDWVGRDVILVADAQTAVAKIRDPNRRPVRVTVTAVARAMGRANSLRAWLPHLRATRDFLDAAVETEAMFARRRIVWTATQFACEGVRPTRKALSLRAALSTRLKHAHATDLEEAVEAVANYVEHGVALPYRWNVDLSATPWAHRDAVGGDARARL